MKNFNFLKRVMWMVIPLLTLFNLSAWGTETLVYTLDGTTTGGTNGYAEESDITQSEKAWKAKGNTTTNPWRIGGKKLTSATERTIYNVTSSLTSDNISTVVLSHGAFSDATKISVSSVKLIVSTASNGSGTKISEISRSFKASDTIQFHRPSGVSWASRYFKIVYTITTDNTNTNRYFTFNYAKFYKEAAPAAKYTVSFSTGTGNPSQSDITEATAGAGITLPSVTPACSGDGWALYGWATSACSSETGIAPEIVGAASATYHPTSNTTLHAVYRKSLATNGFFKMTALSQLTADDTYIIVAQYSTRNYVMTNSYSTSGDYGRLAGSQINETSSGFYSAASIASGYRFTITGSEDNYYIYNSTDSKYVDTGYKTFYVTKKDGDDPWSITVTDGVWTFANAYDGYLGYTGSSNIFESFDSADDLLLYKYSTYSYYSSPSCCTPLGTINGSFSRTIFHSIYAFL